MGRITARSRGGGHKRRIRLVDWHRQTLGEHQVERIEYDPGRSAHIALLRRLPGVGEAEKVSDYSYIVAPQGLKAGDRVQSWRQGLAAVVDPAAPQSVNQPSSSKDAYSGIPEELRQALLRTSALKPGNMLKLEDMPLGQPIHNISLRPNGRSVLCRSAGVSASMVAIGDVYASVKLASGEVRQINKQCTAVVGTVSNPLWSSRRLGKAGRSRWLGWRPKVRGVAMNRFVLLYSPILSKLY